MTLIQEQIISLIFEQLITDPISGYNLSQVLPALSLLFLIQSSDRLINVSIMFIPSRINPSCRETGGLSQLFRSLIAFPGIVAARKSTDRKRLTTITSIALSVVVCKFLIILRNLSKIPYDSLRNSTFLSYQSCKQIVILMPAYLSAHISPWIKILIYRGRIGKKFSPGPYRCIFS